MLKLNSRFNSVTKVWSGLKLPYTIPVDVHISELVLESLKKTPERIVQINYDDGSEMTCEELRMKIIRFAKNLKLVGIQENDVVGIICSNSPNLMAYVNGIMQLGAIVNPMFVGHSSDDLINMFKQTEPKLIICDAEIYERVKEVMKELQSDSPIYTTLTQISGVPFVDELFQETGNEVDYFPEKFINASLKTIAILSSSGSTGPAKGVCMSQTYYLKMIGAAPPEVSRSLSFSPIFWGSAFAALILATILPETRIITREDFSPETFIKIATKYEATHLLMNPPMLTILLQSNLLKDFDKSNVRMVMVLGGIVSEQLRKRFREEFPNTYLMIFYSLTEISVALVFPGQALIGLTVGFVLPNHEIKIVDDNEEALGIGEIGEIYAKFCICPFLVRQKLMI